MLSQEDVENLVNEELSRMEPELRSDIATYLVSPYKEMRFWEYEGMGDKQYPCWIVARYSENRGIAYSQHGHGEGPEGRPWGLVDFAEDIYSQDGLWMTSLSGLFLHFSPTKYS